TRRLRSIGVFQDPNDLCLLLATSMLISLYWLGERRLGGLRVLWLIPLGIFGYAVILTQSRGGLVATAAGSLVLFHARYGTWKTILITVVSVTALLLFYSGRMTEFGSALSADTGQSRIQLWSDGLMAFREHPIFGVGQGLFAEEVSGTQVAHNSYLHCF